MPVAGRAEEVGRRERTRYQALVAEFCDREKLASLSRELETEVPPPSAADNRRRG